MAGGGLVIQRFFQVFTANGTWTGPANLVPGSVDAYCQGESGTAGTSSHGVRSGAGSGAGAFGGQPALGGVGPGTVLTVTVPQGNTGNPTTITGGSVTVQANPGLAPVTTTGGLGGTAGTNTIAFAGGPGNNAISGTAADAGAGGGSAGSTGAGGAAVASTGGPAGTGAAGPPSLAGAAGQNGPGALAAGLNGIAPGGGASGGGGGGAINHLGGSGAPGQAVIIWSVYVFVPLVIPRRGPSRALVRFHPGTTTNAAPAPPVAGTIQPLPTLPAPRRRPSRAWVRFTPGTTTNAAARTSGTIQPRPTVPIPRRRPSRAWVRFHPGTTTNAAPVPRQLLISLASQAGTDDYGNTFPQGIKATAGVIEGPTLVGSDAFFYSPAAGFGNLVQSITEADGSDQYGNAYLAGTATYANNSGLFWSAVVIASGVVSWYKATGPGGPWALESAIGFTFNNLTGGGLTLSAPAGISGTFNIPQPSPAANSAAIISALFAAGIFN